MKKSGLFLAVFFVCSLAFTSCRETTTEKETVVREVEVEAEDDDKGVLERAAEETDKEINKEIDEEIDKIGNDDN